MNTHNGHSIPADKLSSRVRPPNSTPPESAPPAASKSESKSKSESDEQAFARLALLTPANYDRARIREAKKLRIRPQTLDSQVAALRQTVADPAKMPSLELPIIEPWPHPVNIAETLNQVSDRFKMYTVLPSGGPDAIALWIAHSHAFKAFSHTPRLNLSSPERGCGKTTTIDILALMVPKPLRTENLTAPTLFRIVEQLQPTLLLDEVDAYLNQAEELRGLLNAGNRPGSFAYRCEGSGNAVRAFKAHAPAVLAGIGNLPGTLHDRSIHIPLMKALPGEITARFDSHRTGFEIQLGRKLARWAADNFTALQACDPVLPDTAYHRLADNWRPLFAISQLAGADWPQRAVAAFTSLTAHKDLDAQGIGIRLLTDIHHIFTQFNVDRLSSKQLVSALCELTDSPWPEAHQGGKPITETWLARRLRPFSINSRTIRIGDGQTKGYLVEDFANVFSRFLPVGCSRAEELSQETLQV